MGEVYLMNGVFANSIHDTSVGPDTYLSGPIRKGMGGGGGGGECMFRARCKRRAGLLAYRT